MLFLNAQDLAFLSSSWVMLMWLVYFGHTDDLPVLVLLWAPNSTFGLDPGCMSSICSFSAVWHLTIWDEDSPQVICPVVSWPPFFQCQQLENIPFSSIPFCSRFYAREVLPKLVQISNPLLLCIKYYVLTLPNLIEISNSLSAILKSPKFWNWEAFYKFVTKSLTLIDIMLFITLI